MSDMLTLHLFKRQGIVSPKTNFLLGTFPESNATLKSTAPPCSTLSRVVPIGSLLKSEFPRSERKHVHFFSHSTSPVVDCLERRANSDSSLVNKVPRSSKDWHSSAPPR